MVSILDQVVEELEQKNAQQNQVVEEEEEGEEEGVVWYIECIAVLDSRTTFYLDPRKSLDQAKKENKHHEHQI